MLVREYERFDHYVGPKFVHDCAADSYFLSWPDYSRRYYNIRAERIGIRVSYYWINGGLSVKIKVLRLSD